MAKKIFIGVGIVAVVLIVFMGWNIRKYNQEGEMIHSKVQNIFSLLKEEKYAALSQETAGSAPGELSPDVFKKLRSSFAVLRDFQTVDVKTVTGASDNKKAVSGFLVDASGKTTPYEIILEKSGDAWQLYSLDLNTAVANVEGTDDLSATISGIILGDKADEKAKKITRETLQFEPTTPVIYATVFAAHAEGFVNAEVTMKYLPTGEVVGPFKGVAVSSNANGLNASSYFTFSKPTNGWLAGAYELTAVLANGQQKKVSFRVER